MTIKVKVKGLSKVLANIKKASRRVDAAALSAVYVAGNVIMTEAKRRAPLDRGDLRGSGYVTLPQKLGDKVRSEVGFGGPAAAYAVIQHERTEFRHDIGEAKYLERAIAAKRDQAFKQAARAAKRAFNTARSIQNRIHTDDPNNPQGGGTQ